MDVLNNKAIELFEMLKLSDKNINKLTESLNAKDEVMDIKICENEIIDFSVVSENIKRFLYSYIKILFDSKNQQIIKNHIKTNLIYAKYSILPIIAPFTGYYSNKSLKKFIEYEIPTVYIIRWCLEGMDINDFKFDNFCIDYFDKVLNEEEIEYSQLLESMDEYSNVYFISYLLNRNFEKFKDQQQNYRKFLQDKILSAFAKCEFQNNEYDYGFVSYIIKKYLNGDSVVQENTVEDIFKVINKDSVDTSKFGFYLGIAYFCVNKFRFSQLFIKLINCFDFNLCYTNFYDMFLIDEDSEEEVFMVLKRIKDLNDSLSLKTEEYISWISNRLARIDYYKPYIEFLNMIYNTNISVFEKAQIHADRLGVCYLKSYFIKESIEELENYYLNIYIEMFKTLEVPYEIAKDYVIYLKGDKVYSAIQGIINELTGVYFDNVLENLEILRGLYWIKDISQLYTRSIKFFGEINKFDIVYDLLRVNVYNVDQKEISQIIDILKKSELTIEKIIDLIVSNANDNYNSQWSLYYTENILKEENILLEYLNYCEEYNKVFVLESMFNDNKEKYSEMLIRLIKPSTILVRQKIVELLGSYRKSFEVIKPLLFVKEDILRENAVYIFSYWNDEEAMNCLKNALETENNVNIRRLINNILNEITGLI